MGIDYYVCDYCMSGFPDCSSKFRSCEMCGRSYCSDECALLKEIEADEDFEAIIDYDEKYNCRMCRREDANDSTLLHFLLKHFKLSYDDALNLWKKEEIDDGE